MVPVDLGSQQLVGLVETHRTLSGFHRSLGLYLDPPRLAPGRAEKAEQTEKLGSLVYILPRDRRDFRSFVGISFTAGIVEEFLYRGFAFWYLFHFMPVWAAIVVSSFAFGLGHSYQGAGGVVRVTLVGVAFGLFYLLTGSIWLTMLAHVILDVMQGLSCLEVLGEDGKE